MLDYTDVEFFDIVVAFFVPLVDFVAVVAGEVVYGALFAAVLVVAAALDESVVHIADEVYVVVANAVAVVGIEFF